jgi:hypothetical protein
MTSSKSKDNQLKQQQELLNHLQNDSESLDIKAAESIRNISAITERLKMRESEINDLRSQ